MQSKWCWDSKIIKMEFCITKIICFKWNWKHIIHGIHRCSNSMIHLLIYALFDFIYKALQSFSFFNVAIASGNHFDNKDNMAFGMMRRSLGSRKGSIEESIPCFDSCFELQLCRRCSLPFLQNVDLQVYFWVWNSF